MTGRQVCNLSPGILNPAADRPVHFSLWSSLVMQTSLIFSLDHAATGDFYYVPGHQASNFTLAGQEMVCA